MKQSYDEGRNKYSGYAKYRELFSLTHARLLWWFESDEDIYHPTPHQTDFYTEITQAEMDNRLAARSTWNDVLTSFDMEHPEPEDFHLLREFSHSLVSLLDYVEDQLNEE
ncbi:hypothetical protein OUZ56_032959 [Daphnia magna]|uniref:Uncharacterized protein n=1 Tax=Daphnia magna TaxID=35525 RepID=A0ABQ9ZXB4_9CRUS|nr:hypothetical protein OUZ56_032959 [Daphnia magna]